MINIEAPLCSLQDRLDKDLSWRKKEISNLFLHIETQVGELRIALIRGSITLLYAHWEGFIKNASVSYLQCIRDLNLTLNCLKDNFWHISLGQKFSSQQISFRSYSHQKQVFEYIQRELKNEQLLVAPKYVIDTKSNLKFEVFQTIAKQIGVDISWYETKKNFINTRLLKLRNAIAHGEFSKHEDLREDFRVIKKEIIIFLDTYRDLIITSFEKKEFLR